jgi:hypothetical protein
MPSARLGQSAWKLVQSPFVIFVIAVVSRLWVAAQLLPAKAWPFFYQYQEPSRIAWAVASGYGYSSPWPGTPLLPTAQQPPVYPLLLAGIFKLSGAYSLSSLWTAIVLNAIFSALTAVAILRIGKPIFGPLPGVLAAWVWSCWLYEAAVSIRLWESSLSALLLAIALLLLPGFTGSQPRSRWLIFGLLAGVASLNNATLLAVFPFLWLWLWIGHTRRGHTCTRMALASMGICLLTLLPWTIRNHQAFHRLLPIRDNFGLELWIGNHEGSIPTSGSEFPMFNPSEYNRLGEIRFMETKRQIALQFVGQHPGQFLRRSVRRFFLFWTAPDQSTWPYISVLAWLGLILALKRDPMNAAPYAVVLLIFPVVYYITHAFPTYRHPIDPVILLLAAWVLISAAETAGGQLTRKRLRSTVKSSS